MAAPEPITYELVAELVNEHALSEPWPVRVVLPWRLFDEAKRGAPSGPSPCGAASIPVTVEAGPARIEWSDGTVVEVSAMPIRPENRDRYPPDWPEISAGIRFGRAEGRCECDGRCGMTHDGGRCDRVHGGLTFRGEDALRNARTRTDARGYGRVVLTTAHLDHTPENNDPSNLLALCQACHLRYDRGKRTRPR